MKIGAQMYSIRLQTKTTEDLRESLRRMKKAGYEMIQASGRGIVETDPYVLRDLTQEFGFPVPLSHMPVPKLENELDEVIRYHKIVGIPVVGLGAMPKELRDGKYETFRGFLNRYNEIEKKLNDAGLRFAYHNHNFEFDPLDNGRCIFDHLAEDCDWDIIADVCWIHVAGRDVPRALTRLKGRIYNAHLKDMLSFTPEQKEAMKKDHSLVIETAQKNFCPLGQGEVDLIAAAKSLEENGCVNAFVEQDNATNKPDPCGEMEQSAAYLKSVNLL